MTFQINLVSFIFIVIAIFSGVWALLKIIAIQFERGIKRDLQERFSIQEVASKAQSEQLNLRLDVLDSAAKSDAGQWQRVERELLNLKADLPLHYVRREDYIRGQSVIEAKLDGLGTKLENAHLRTVNNAINSRRSPA
jgi:hypothetical protein